MLVGREGSGRAVTLRCLLGEVAPRSGRVLVLGRDARRERRDLRRRIRFDEAKRELRLDTEPPTAFSTTDDPGRAAASDRVAFLKEGRLVLEEDVSTLRTRFRRVRYVNEITETRTEYGNELDLFHAVRVKVRGWGVEAIVSNFDEAAFESFRATDGVRDARSESMTVEEIFAAVVGET